MNLTTANQRRLYLILLWAVALAGFLLRVWSLGEEQHFRGDQGRDYLVVQEWFREGKWPLLGPLRSAGDYAIGPGWFYTIALPLVLTGFHIRTGATLMAFAGACAVLLAASWVRRGSGSRIAALVLASVLSLAAGWDRHSYLWNPMLLPFATVALAWLLQRRPIRNSDDDSPENVLADRPLTVWRLAATLVLLAILPQWHTTGVLIVLAALPALVLATWRSRKDLRAEFRAVRWGALALLLASVALLYVPPLVEAVQNDGGNMAGYWERTSNRVQETGAERSDANPVMVFLSPQLRTAYELLIGAVGHQPVEFHLLLILFTAGAAGGAILACRWREPSLLFLLLLLLGFGALGIVSGTQEAAYYFLPTHPISPILLALFLGVGLRIETDARHGKILRGLSALLLLWLAAVAARNVPLMTHIARGNAWYRGSLPRTVTVVERIRREVLLPNGTIPFSLLLEEPGDFSAAERVLLARDRIRPVNRDYYTHDIREQDFGSVLLLITQGATFDHPVRMADGTPVPLLEDLAVAKLWALRRDALPDRFDRIEVRREEGVVVIRCVLLPDDTEVPAATH